MRAAGAPPTIASIACGQRERVLGEPTLVVDAAGRSVRIAAVSQAGVMGEVADALTRAMPVA
jgi:hypothetical protein